MAVHDVRSSLPTVFRTDTNPIRSKRTSGKAALIYDAPAFHHGPRPLQDDFQARALDKPNRTKYRCPVYGRFHCRQRIQRNLPRTQPSIVDRNDRPRAPRNRCVSFCRSRWRLCIAIRSCPWVVIVYPKTVRCAGRATALCHSPLTSGVC